MKIAICLYGTSGYSFSLANNLKEREPLDVNEPLNSLIKNIASINNADIFVHSWSKNRQDEITKIIEPKNKLFENFKTFDKKNPYFNAIKSRFYSQSISNKLMKDFSDKNKINYDFVMHSRLDLIWFSKFEFSKLEKDKFYASHWNISEKRIDLEPDISNDNNNLGPFDKSNYGIGVGLMDHWFISNFKNMNLFSRIYDDLYKLEFLNWFNNFKSKKTLKNKNRYNPLHLAHIQATRHHFNIDYAKYRGFDYDLYRRYKNPHYFKKLQ